MAFKYEWEEFICNTLAKARKMAGNKAKDFEVVIAVKDDSDGAPPLVSGAYNGWTGDFFAQLDEVDWENGLPELANRVEKVADKDAKIHEKVVEDTVKEQGLSFGNPDDEDKIDEIRDMYHSYWMFSVIVHKEPEYHNHFFGHGGIGASFLCPYYMEDDGSTGEFVEDTYGEVEETKEKFLEDFAKALEEDGGVNESRHFRGRMLRESKADKVYYLKQSYRNKYLYFKGTLPELIDDFSYTLMKGHRENARINTNPTTFKGLISNINKAVDATEGGYDRSYVYPATAEEVSANESFHRRGRLLKEDRIRKSKPIAVIQGNYGYGWDDESSYDTDDVSYLKTLKHDFDEYRKSGHNALYRIVHKRQKLDKPQRFVKGEWLDVEDEPVKAEACGKRKKGKKVLKESEDYMEGMYEILDDMISAVGISATLIDAPDCPEDFSDWYNDAADEIYDYLLDNETNTISDELYTKWYEKLEKIWDKMCEEEDED